MGFPGGAIGKELACQCKSHKRCGFDSWREDSLEKGMATHPSILAWRIPWIEELGGLKSIGSQSQSDRSNFTHKHLHTHTHTHTCIIAI